VRLEDLKPPPTAIVVHTCTDHGYTEQSKEPQEGVGATALGAHAGREGGHGGDRALGTQPDAGAVGVLAALCSACDGASLRRQDQGSVRHWAKSRLPHDLPLMG
jgi:hypothetical protein